MELGSSRNDEYINFNDSQHRITNSVLWWISVSVLTRSFSLAIVQRDTELPPDSTNVLPVLCDPLVSAIVALRKDIVGASTMMILALKVHRRGQGAGDSVANAGY
ncbi:hypothetical protein CBL_07921 [Carabus blaptoides fortunei]